MTDFCQKPAPQNIVDLVQQFERDYDNIKTYSETDVRCNFIDPFFKALGWQPDRNGTREFIREDKVTVEGKTKAPDYGFYINNQRKFFLEAKRANIGLTRSTDVANKNALQLRRYGWSASLHVSILTNFKEIAVYNCRVKPQQTDIARQGLIRHFKYDEDYIDNWAEICELLSREAVATGSLEKYIEREESKKFLKSEIIPVDDDFLQVIQKWRANLAQSLIAHNHLSIDELNFAVQTTINRIVFLRICEDLGIEPYGHLRKTVEREGYGGLFRLFRQADSRYNSGLFHFFKEENRTTQHDELTGNLEFSNYDLKTIVNDIYTPYEFSVIPVEVLGHIYEQFLGKVIVLDSKNRISVEDKPEVRKAGGVYYTPDYIVNYIVENTVGKLLEGKTPAQAEKLRILDPACGSGSFLLGAYDYLLKWHLKYYVKNSPKKRKSVIFEVNDAWQLTTKEKKRILLNNIHGVDIDEQAVEIAKFSLLLKVLEGESKESIAANEMQLKLIKERVLPDLDNNIKCGNSLIDDPEVAGNKAFDWNSEFKEIMNNGGFDAVIGNPPWVSLTGRFRNEICTKFEIDYLVEKFQGNTYMPNMYEYFVAHGLNIVKNNGFFSFIVPDRLGFNDQFIPLRQRILEETHIISLVYKMPFPNVVVDTLTFILRKDFDNKDAVTSISKYGNEEIKIIQSSLFNSSTLQFSFFTEIKKMNLISKIKSMKAIVYLKEICDYTSGFGGKSKMICETQTNQKQIPILKGRSIERYRTLAHKIFWFEFKKENITGRTTDKKKLSASPKILLRKTGNEIIATYDDTSIFPEQSLYFLYNNKTELNFKFILGLLNSKLLTFYFQIELLTNPDSIAQVKTKDLALIPIRAINFDDPSDKASHDKIVKLVDLMLSLNKALQTEKNDFLQTVQEEKGIEKLSTQLQNFQNLEYDAFKKELRKKKVSISLGAENKEWKEYFNTTKDKVNALQNQINQTDREIDFMVYALYELTPEEIEIVENSTR